MRHAARPRGDGLPGEVVLCGWPMGSAIVVDDHEVTCPKCREILKQAARYRKRAGAVGE